MMENERVALALIALITGVMGFVESMAAVPAASTAMAADALSFVQHSISAGFSLWSTAGTITRQRWTIHMQGFVMAALGGLVCLIAVRRFFLGSIPHPMIMIVIGTIALIADLTVGAIVLRPAPLIDRVPRAVAAEPDRLRRQYRRDRRCCRHYRHQVQYPRSCDRRSYGGLLLSSRAGGSQSPDAPMPAVRVDGI
jgi:hypothetical protein